MESSDPTDRLRDDSDLFYHGVIAKLFPKNNMGIVRTESGREVPFAYNLVIVVGATQDPNNLKEGQRVGYDLGWTSKGVKVTKIKVYAETGTDVKSPDLERQGGQG